MNLPWLAAFIAFGLAAAGTPGPNNLILASIAAGYGLRRAVPAILGVSLGFSFMIAAAGLGLAGVFRQYPQLAEILKWLGSGWLLYLAWRIATSPVELAANETTTANPPGFWQMAAFQWVNPKAWSMVMAMMGVYAGRNIGYREDMLLMAAMFTIIGTITASSWAFMGTLAGRLLKPQQLLWFNRIMGLLLAASVVLMWQGQ